MKKILVAVSNENDRKVFTYYIKKYFVAELFYANSAEEAMAALIYDLDIVIYDSCLGNGDKFFKYCNENKNKISIIAITTLNEVDIVDKLFSLGVHSYLNRPLNSYRLYEQLEELYLIR